ncbi:uncharacterized protein N7479_003955 [Penicillium vulpinum]|uniref:uncharacterized protein n=1 Tax=Penicillium vulpinum TaxID=29845 RepID=UPI002546BB55|nr:uncharacterized protein N7479_003955 [Penicillium vulpinum]KAJ5964079.1 hypothetical protein N7479_003955 [Penicillium vulpinum]
MAASVQVFLAFMVFSSSPESPPLGSDTSFQKSLLMLMATLLKEQIVLEVQHLFGNVRHDRSAEFYLEHFTSNKRVYLET